MAEVTVKRTTFEIDRSIAEQLGWVVEKLPAGWRIKSPTGDKNALRFASDEREAWVDAYDAYILPHFTESFDAIITYLPQDADFSSEARYNVTHNGRYQARLTVRKPQLNVFVNKGDTREEAAALSFEGYLVWKKALGG